MKTKVMKYIGAILVFIIAAPLIYTTLYFMIEIRPHTESISEKVGIYNKVTSNLALLEKMAVSEEGQNGMARYVSHSLAVENTESGFRNIWHLVGLHWHLWVRVMYSEQEQYALWLALAPYGKGRGMNEAATFFFNKPIEKLSCHQLAELVVMIRAPTTFKPGSEKTEQRINSFSEFLETYC